MRNASMGTRAGTEKASQRKHKHVLDKQRCLPSLRRKSSVDTRKNNMLVVSVSANAIMQIEKQTHEPLQNRNVLSSNVYQRDYATRKASTGKLQNINAPMSDVYERNYANRKISTRELKNINALRSDVYQHDYENWKANTKKLDNTNTFSSDVY